jgi:hypothetical protein
MNFGAMVANIITGVGGAIINFVALGERIGVFGARVDGAAMKMVGGLGEAAAFMTGPWGAALALGGLAIAGLYIWLLHVHTAAQQFVNDTSKIVEGATNLQVLNAIGGGVSATLNHLAAANANLAAVTVKYDQVVQQNGEHVSGVASRYDYMAGAIGGATENLGTAAQAVLVLSKEQQTLYTQNQNVIAGALSISKTYGVGFVAALAMADMAGVKLINGFVGQSNAARQAQIQVQAMFLGYQKMDLAGGTLANTMNAIAIQSGLANTQISKVNQAWDQFIAMSTSLTGSFTQLNLDIAQMGNVASTTPSKISAFAGQTTLSVAQIATALKSFSGQSAQIWQSFNQSVSQANTFMDNLRVAAAAASSPG